MAADKWKHFILGIPLGVILMIAGLFFFPSAVIIVTVFSVIALIVICYGFEIFSLLSGKGHYELMDAIVGIVGGLIGIGGTLIFV